MLYDALSVCAVQCTTSFGTGAWVGLSFANAFVYMNSVNYLLLYALAVIFVVAMLVPMRKTASSTIETAKSAKNARKIE